jgi:integrase
MRAKSADLPSETKARVYNTASHSEPPPNKKSAQGVHREKTRPPKTAAAYWTSKVKKPAESGLYGVQIKYNGTRARFPLGTADKQLASERARDRFLSLVANGWEATLQKFKPEAAKPVKVATIGAWLDAVKDTAGFRASTFTNYANSIRQIAAEIQSIGDQPEVDEGGNVKRNRKKKVKLLSRRHTKGHALWVEKVDALSLAILTPIAIQRWKLAHIEKAGAAPDARRRAENTAASRMRSARALFSARARQFAAQELSLPDPLPFAGVKMPKKGSTTYQSRIDAGALINAAKKELDGDRFKIFALALLCGLRKGEIDSLTWGQVDLAKGVIRVEQTEHFQPKSEDSVGEVDLDDELQALMRKWKEQGEGDFVVAPDAKPLPPSDRVVYRCDDEFAKVYAWLRAHGVTARKPLHELRKELGAILASEHGIFAAQSVLRHAQISTTAAYYTDKKKRISAGLGKLLG